MYSESSVLIQPGEVPLPKELKNKTYSNMLFSGSPEPTYCFISEKPDSFTMTQYTLVKSRPGSAKKWSKYVLNERITVKIKTPKYLGFPTINVFLFKTKRQGRKTLSNVSLTFGTRYFLSQIINNYLTWFMDAFENLMQRNNLEYDYSALDKVVPYLEKNQSFRARKYLDLLMFPFRTHMVPDTDSAEYKKYPLSRVRNFEQLIAYGKYTYPPLIEWLRKKYDSNQFSETHVFLMSVCTQYSQEDLLAVLKVAEVVEEKTRWYSWLPYQRYKGLAEIGWFSTMKNLRGLFSKLPPTVLSNLLVDAGVKYIKSNPNLSPKAANLKYDMSIKLPSQELLNVWSKNYRKIKPIKKQLTSLEEHHIVQYIEEALFKPNVKGDLYDSYLKRLNRLHIVGEEITDLNEIPKAFKSIIRLLPVSSEDSKSRFTTRPTLLYPNSLNLFNSVLPNSALIIHANNQFSPEYAWNQAIELFEKIDTIILRLFARAKVPFDIEIASIFLKPVYAEGRVQWDVLESAHKQWPVQVIKLLHYGMSYKTITILKGNKISFNQIYDTFIIDDKLLFPENWILESFGLKKSQPVPDDIF